jgi:hypothetical protein
MSDQRRISQVITDKSVMSYGDNCVPKTHWTSNRGVTTVEGSLRLFRVLLLGIEVRIWGKGNTLGSILRGERMAAEEVTVVFR